MFLFSSRRSSSGGDAAAPLRVGIRVDVKPAARQIQEAPGPPDDSGAIVSTPLYIQTYKHNFTHHGFCMNSATQREVWGVLK